MQGPSTTPAAATRADPVRAIAAFMRGFSLEATRPTAREVAALAEVLPGGTRVYVSAVPGRSAAESIAIAVRLKAVGLEPVPHLAVRNFATLALIDDFLARLTAEAGVRCVLVIAGDRDPPAGELRSALDVIDGALLHRRGIVEIGLAGYPDGHPRITEQELDLALKKKIDAAETLGLSIHIVTQFCFRPAAIVAWLAKLHEFGIEHPVRIGLAGPTSVATLMRYASRCGVRALAQGLAHHAGLARELFAMWAPDGFVSALAQARGSGALKPHFFSFGGLLPTARWAQAVAQGRVTLESGQRFRVDPAG